MYSNTPIGIFTPIFQKRKLRQLVSTGPSITLEHLNSSLPGSCRPYSSDSMLKLSQRPQESQHKESWAHTDKLGQYVSRTFWSSNHSGVRKWERQGASPDHSVGKDECSWGHSEDALPAFYSYRRVGLRRGLFLFMFTWSPASLGNQAEHPVD